MKRMRVKSRKQQEETEKWKEQAKKHEGRMSTNFSKAKEDKKRLNEKINVLEGNFKYAGLKTSLGLPQDEQYKM